MVSRQLPLYPSLLLKHGPINISVKHDYQLFSTRFVTTTSVGNILHVKFDYITIYNLIAIPFMERHMKVASFNGYVQIYADSMLGGLQF